MSTGSIGNTAPPAPNTISNGCIDNKNEETTGFLNENCIYIQLSGFLQAVADINKFYLNDGK